MKLVTEVSAGFSKLLLSYIERKSGYPSHVWRLLKFSED